MLATTGTLGDANFKNQAHRFHLLILVGLIVSLCFQVSTKRDEEGKTRKKVDKVKASKAEQRQKATNRVLLCRSMDLAFGGMVNSRVESQTSLLSISTHEPSTTIPGANMR